MPIARNTMSIGVNICCRPPWCAASAVEVLVSRHAARAAQADVRSSCRALVVGRAEDLPVRGEQEERAEEVEDPAEVLDQLRAQQDEDAAQHERDHDADHQHFLLELRRHRELAMMMTNTNRLSIARLYSVSQPATNWLAYSPSPITSMSTGEDQREPT